MRINGLSGGRCLVAKIKLADSGRLASAGTVSVGKLMT